MIRYSVEAKSKMLEGLEAFVEDFDDVAYEQFQESFNEIGPHLIGELHDEPPIHLGEIEWTSKKQRKAFFATGGFGRGIPTRRTGKLKNAWYAKIDRDGDEFFFVVDNPFSVSKFVYGSLAKNRSAALRYQQKFHAKTGWQPATDTVKFWVDAFTEDYLKRMRKIATTKFKKKAYTR